ncbi:hypothetical protein A3K82_02775 [Candidatus Pacearchaeota archaeon RBG_19FT_COMBO_34_9]|nr:MAG: hypothetical protein A3K82_02775 [Candidatus Pacearchaeota archaeon RBG_19FT_COMBO_34_9]OGJ16981.1 MAG: hypothetical protein A3K74_01150 [Candidatus Pacearchaeota archaeon RBG_13_33_26]
MTDCIFCKIANGEVPAVKIWENKDFFASLDINPMNPGHTLVIPKKHNDYLFDLSDREYVELMLHAKFIAKKLKEKLNPKRIGMIVEGFAVPHVHIHLIPLNHGEELNFSRAKPASPEELNKMKEKIKK